MNERTSNRMVEAGDIYCSDGYDWMEASAKKGWHTLSAWGSDGWDLGSWPLVVFSVRKRENGNWDVCQHVEGDLTIIEDATVAERDAYIDLSAVWHWVHGQSDGPVQCYVDADGNPTPGNQNWSNRINLVRQALGAHLRSLGIEPSEQSWEWWDQLRAHRGTNVDDPTMLDGWVLPEWRGPYSARRSEG